MPSATPVQRHCALAVVLALVLVQSACATPPGSGRSYQFFDPATSEHLWFERIADWQDRERGDRGHRAESDGRAIPPVREAARAPARDFARLEDKFVSFQIREKREMARAFNVWSQEQALAHYKPDVYESPDEDHWPTLRELFASNGDDCDGMDLLVYGLMRDLGFRQGEIYRAIVRRDADDAHHMVTFWFEDSTDPWVIDATGAMTIEMRRLSQIHGWTPRMLFDDQQQFNVIELSGATSWPAAGPSPRGSKKR
jgi:hypothetical protein